MNDNNMTDQPTLGQRIENTTTTLLDGYRELARELENGAERRYLLSLARDLKRVEHELASLITGR